MNKEITAQGLREHLGKVVPDSVLAQIPQGRMDECLTGMVGSLQSLGQATGRGR